MEALIRQHARIALQVSGGRDSLACLFLLRPWWDKLTVYWLNSGDAFPEVAEIMAKVRALVPHFVEVDGRQPDIIRQHGIPSDIVPASATPIGIMGQGGGALIQGRYDCCWRVLMQPLHQRMRDDGITLLARGQKNADALKSPLRDGDVLDGFTYLFPIQDWSEEQVDAYLATQEIQPGPFYASMGSTPDCMTCSAWWDENRAQYLKARHPAHYALYQQRLDQIQQAVSGHLEAFNREVTA
ncbi:hypothetical protein CEK28_08700 [Xenophilus sp. AP218F]|nr:hypothetical protein CEK28_08700 [Xenophilus sp. AP218F]